MLWAPSLHRLNAAVRNESDVAFQPPRFAFTIVVALAGGSLLYGYNTSVVNTPATTIQQWYVQCYTQRAGLDISNPNTTGASESTDVTALWSITTSIYFMAGMVSAFFFGAIADRIGRKRTLLLNNILAILAAACFLVCYPICSPELLIVGRVIIGLNCGIGLGLCPLYLSEIASKSLRGPVTGSSYLGCSIGLLLAQILGLSEVLGGPTTWTYCLALTGIPAIVQLVLLPFCPESPRYLLLTKKDEEAAKKAYVWLYGKENGEEEYFALRKEVALRSTMSMRKLQYLSQANLAPGANNKVAPLAIQTNTLISDGNAEAEQSADFSKATAKPFAIEVGSTSTSAASSRKVSMVDEARKAKVSIVEAPQVIPTVAPPKQGSVSLRELFTQRQYALPLFVAIVCHIAQQWSGINAVFTYSGDIFKGIGLPADVTQYCTLATGASSLISVACCIPLFTRVGRRTLVLVAISVMAFGLLLLTVSGATAPLEPIMNYIAILAVVIFIFGYAPIGTTPPVLVSEMFLQNARGMAFSIAIAVRWGSNIIILFAFPYMQQTMGPYTFMVFFGVMIACLIGLGLFLPETKGKPMMEIHDMVSHGFDNIQLHVHSVDLDHFAYHLHLPFVHSKSDHHDQQDLEKKEGLNNGSHDNAGITPDNTGTV